MSDPMMTVDPDLPVNPVPIIIVAVFAPIAIASVVLRFYARQLKGLALMADDWMILPALFFALGQAATLLANAVIGNLGNHQPLDADGKAYNSPKLEVFQMMEYVSFITFVCALAFAKLSVLHLYLRIFDLQRSFRITVWIVYGLNLAWGISFFFGYIWKCDPIPDYWMTANLTGRCLPNKFNYAFAFSNIILDAIILILPLPMVWSLNMSRRQKIVISGVFLMGSSVLVLSIAKAVAFFIIFRLVEKDNDIMWDEAPLFYFSVPEALFAVVSACLPTLRPVLRHFKVPLNSATSRNRNYAQGDSGLGSLQQRDTLEGVPVRVLSRELQQQPDDLGNETGLHIDRKNSATGVMMEWYPRKVALGGKPESGVPAEWMHGADEVGLASGGGAACATADVHSNASTTIDDDCQPLRSATKRTLERIVEPSRHPIRQVPLGVDGGNPSLAFNWEKQAPPAKPTARWFEEFGPLSRPFRRG